MREGLEATLRRLVADEIGEYLANATAAGRPLPDELDQRQMALAILRRELEERGGTGHGEGAFPL